MSQSNALSLGPETTLINALGTIAKAATMVAVDFPRSSKGRGVIKFSCDVDLTLGDGTFAGASGAIALVADRGSGTNPELVGFLGVILQVGVAAPQIPMLASGGANPRSWSQLVEGLDGYKRFAVVGYAADNTQGGANHITVTLSPYAG